MGFIVKESGYTEAFINENADKVDWDKISQYSNLSERFINKNLDKLNINKVVLFNKVSEKFIRTNLSNIKWETLFFHQNLSKGFLKEVFLKKVNLKDEKEILSFSCHLKIYKNISLKELLKKY